MKFLYIAIALLGCLPVTAQNITKWVNTDSVRLTARASESGMLLSLFSHEGAYLSSDSIHINFNLVDDADLTKWDFNGESLLFSRCLKNPIDGSLIFYLGRAPYEKGGNKFSKKTEQIGDLRTPVQLLFDRQMAGLDLPGSFKYDICYKGNSIFVGIWMVESKQFSLWEVNVDKKLTRAEPNTPFVGNTFVWKMVSNNNFETNGSAFTMFNIEKTFEILFDDGSMFTIGNNNSVSRKKIEITKKMDFVKDLRMRTVRVSNINDK